MTNSSSILQRPRMLRQHSYTTFRNELLNIFVYTIYNHICYTHLSKIFRWRWLQYELWGSLKYARVYGQHAHVYMTVMLQQAATNLPWSEPFVKDTWSPVHHRQLGGVQWISDLVFQNLTGRNVKWGENKKKKTFHGDSYWICQVRKLVR